MARRKYPQVGIRPNQSAPSWEVLRVPVVVKAKNNDNTNDVIRKFKKAVSSTDLVQKVKNRAFYQKPSQVKAVKKREFKRAQKRLRSLKRQKNISPESISRLLEIIQ